MGRHAPFDIPRELLIRGKRWLVLLDQDLTDAPRDVRSRIDLTAGGHLGSTYPDGHPQFRREIHLSTKRNRDERQLASTFLHEVLHACSSQNAGVSMALEEKFIYDVERPLLRVLEQLDWRLK